MKSKLFYKNYILPFRKSLKDRISKGTYKGRILQPRLIPFHKKDHLQQIHDELMLRKMRYPRVNFILSESKTCTEAGHSCSSKPKENSNLPPVMDASKEVDPIIHRFKSCTNNDVHPRIQNIILVSSGKVGR